MVKLGKAMPSTSGDKKKDMKKSNLMQFLFSLLIILLINVVGYYIFTRFDLTSEKRYTLNKSTKKLLKEVDDIVYFKVYLEGDFPAGFKRLRNSTKEMLDEFRAYNDNIQYEFINPNTVTDKKEQMELYKQLVQKGLQPTNLEVKEKSGSTQQIIFPAVEVMYKGRSVPVQLLLNQFGVAPEEVLNNSIQSLEYNLSNAIRKLVVNYKPAIAFIQGHGELDGYETADIYNALNEYYRLERVTLDEQINSLTDHKIDSTGKVTVRNKFKAIIVAKPDSAFSEKDKFILDQFVMYGGKVLWLIDPVFASMDSLRTSTVTPAITLDVNLTDLFFKYGVRLNTNLVQDMASLPIPMVTGQVGGQPKIGLVPWLYFPVITPTQTHPIVKNLNAIKTEFVSSIDTIETGAKNKKTVLLATSNYSRLINMPAMIDLEAMRKQPDERLFNKPFLPVAVLVEGVFESNYQHRMPAEILNNKTIGFKDLSKKTAMIFVADGDIIKNQYDYTKGYPYPLGYDKYTRQMFGNKEFILNCMNYLCDDSGMMSVRSRELKLRLLDKSKIEKYRIRYQVINLIAPLVILALFGIIYAYFRKRKYTRK